MAPRVSIDAWVSFAEVARATSGHASRNVEDFETNAVFGAIEQRRGAEREEIARRHHHRAQRAGGGACACLGATHGTPERTIAVAIVFVAGPAIVPVVIRVARFAAVAAIVSAQARIRPRQLRRHGGRHDDQEKRGQPPECPEEEPGARTNEHG